MENMEIKDHVLIIGDYAEELPRLPFAATVSVWQVTKEYVESGYFVTARVYGEPETIPACSQKDAVLLGRLELEPHPDAMLTAAKKSRLAVINEAFDRDFRGLSERYPQGEISTWPQQLKEAEAVSRGLKAETPLLATMAAFRGIAPETLAGKVLTKSAAYSEAAGRLIGFRQAMEDAIEKAETLDEVYAVEWQVKTKT